MSSLSSGLIPLTANANLSSAKNTASGPKPRRAASSSSASSAATVRHSETSDNELDDLIGGTTKQSLSKTNTGDYPVVPKSRTAHPAPAARPGSTLPQVGKTADLGLGLALSGGSIGSGTSSIRPTSLSDMDNMDAHLFGGSGKPQLPARHQQQQPQQSKLTIPNIGTNTFAFDSSSNFSGSSGSSGLDKPSLQSLTTANTSRDSVQRLSVFPDLNIPDFDSIGSRSGIVTSSDSMKQPRRGRRAMGDSSSTSLGDSGVLSDDGKRSHWLPGKDDHKIQNQQPTNNFGLPIFEFESPDSKSASKQQRLGSETSSFEELSNSQNESNLMTPLSRRRQSSIIRDHLAPASTSQNVESSLASLATTSSKAATLIGGMSSSTTFSAPTQQYQPQPSAAKPKYQSDDEDYVPAFLLDNSANTSRRRRTNPSSMTQPQFQQAQPQPVIQPIFTPVSQPVQPPASLTFLNPKSKTSSTTPPPPLPPKSAEQRSRNPSATKSPSPLKPKPSDTQSHKAISHAARKLLSEESLSSLAISSPLSSVMELDSDRDFESKMDLNQGVEERQTSSSVSRTNTGDKSRLDGLVADLQKKVRELETSVTKKQTEVEKLEQKVKETEEKRETERKTTEQAKLEKLEAIAKHETEVVNLKMKFEQELKNLKEKRDADIASEAEKLKARHEEEYTKLKHEYTEELQAKLKEAVEATEHAKHLEILVSTLTASSSKIEDIQRKLESDHMLNIQERETALIEKERQVEDMRKVVVAQAGELEMEKSKYQKLFKTMESTLRAAQETANSERDRIIQDRIKLEEDLREVKKDKEILRKQLETERQDFLISKEEWKAEKARITTKMAEDTKNISLEKADLKAKNSALEHMLAEFENTKKREEAEFAAERQVYHQKSVLLEARLKDLHTDTAAFRLEKAAYESKKAKLDAEAKMFEDRRASLEAQVKDAAEKHADAVRQREKAESHHADVLRMKEAIDRTRREIDEEKRNMIEKQQEYAQERMEMVKQRKQLEDERRKNWAEMKRSPSPIHPVGGQQSFMISGIMDHPPNLGNNTTILQDEPSFAYHLQPSVTFSKSVLGGKHSFYDEAERKAKAYLNQTLEMPEQQPSQQSSQPRTKSRIRSLSVEVDLDKQREDIEVKVMSNKLDSYIFELNQDKGSIVSQLDYILAHENQFMRNPRSVI